jgi:spore coat protein CotH
MEAKEKAKELVDKFTNLYEGINLGLAKKHWAKQSALIAVDEILSIIDEEEQYRAYKYWNEVKQEIENL